METEEHIDRVNHPSHYQGNGLECIDAMIAAFGTMQVEIFCKLNAFKYIWRSEHKGTYTEDMKKAAWYLNKHNELLNQKEG